MKKLLIISLTTTLILSLFSCRQKKNIDVKTEEKTKASESAAPAEVSTSGRLLDDAEDGSYWSPVRDAWSDWGNKFMVNEFSLSTDTTDEWASEGDYSLSFEYNKFAEASDTEAAHFFCTDLVETDWTGYTKLSLDVNNLSANEIGLQMYTKSGEWHWSDTDAITIPSGVSHLVYDISEKGVSDPSTVLELGFVLYGCKENNSILLDNIRLEE